VSRKKEALLLVGFRDGAKIELVCDLDAANSIALDLMSTPDVPLRAIPGFFFGCLLSLSVK
jgi:hypothetical protein